MSSSPSIGSPSEGAAATSRRDPAPLRRRALILDRSEERTIAWWLDPIRALVFIVVPIFCFAAYLNQFNYWLYDATANFVNRETFLIALYSAAMLILGIAIGKLFVRREVMITIVDPDRCTTVLTWFGWIAIIAYLILFGTLLYRIDLVLALLRGQTGAPEALRAALGRVPGVTSLVELNIVYMALISALITLGKYRMSARIRNITIAIIVLTFMRSVLNSERLALLEILAAMFVVPAAYYWRASSLRATAPFAGVVAVFAAFAAGEYFRSWQYYQRFYDSYFDFITQRFAGYFSTSINNGAGAYLMYGKSNPTAEITVGWVSKFPGLGRFFGAEGDSMLYRYLDLYSTREFNNPGGFYSAFLDYNFFVASLFMIALGIVVGMIYRAFVNRNLLGLMLYPTVFLGITDLIRIVYLTETRTLPIFVGAIVAFRAVRPVQVPRGRFIAYASAASQRADSHAN